MPECLEYHCYDHCGMDLSYGLSERTTKSDMQIGINIMVRYRIFLL